MRTIAGLILGGVLAGSALTQDGSTPGRRSRNEREAIRKIVQDLKSPDPGIRKDAVSRFSGLDERARRKALPRIKKIAVDLAGELERLRAKEIRKRLSARPDPGTLAAKRTEIIEMQKVTVQGPQGQAQTEKLRKKIEELWQSYYPDLSDIPGSPPFRPLWDQYDDVLACIKAAGADPLVKQLEDFRARFADYDPLEFLLTPHQLQVMRENDRLQKRARPDLKLSPLEYECAVAANLFLIMMGKRPLKLDLDLCASCRDWSKHLAKDVGALEHSHKHPNECVGRNSSGNGREVWLGLVTSDWPHISAVYRWGRLGIGHHGGYWTWGG